MDKFGKVITIVVLAIAVLIFIIDIFFTNQHWSESLMTAVAIAGGGGWELGAPRPAGPCPFQESAEHRPHDLHQQALHYGPCAPCVPGTCSEQLMASQADRPSQANLARAFS